MAAGEALRAGEEVELAIRPERVRLATGPGRATAEARIEGLVYQGAQTEVTARLGDGQRVLVFVTEPAPMPLAPGQIVHLQLPRGRVHGAGVTAARSASSRGSRRRA